MADDQSNLERLKETFVYAPIGFALYARDTAPGFVKLFVARGRGALDGQKAQLDANVHQAKAMGEFALKHGGPAAAQKVGDGIAGARAVAESALSAVRPAPPPPPPPDADHVADLIDAAGAATETGSDTPVDREVDLVAEATHEKRPAPSSAFLPIPEYDELSASQVVERLDGLGSGELTAIADYETATRGRRTILGKIEQLTV